MRVWRLKRYSGTTGVAELSTGQRRTQQSSTGIAHTMGPHGASGAQRQSHFSHGTGDVLQKPGRVALVHNGIIRLHEELRRALQAKGYAFSSQTDTRVVHLVDSLYDGDDVRALRLRCSNCVALTPLLPFAGRPHRVVGARAGRR
jgi:glucosamine--fructose-6-phosphate aminotransferase (isomerizing)